MENASEYIIRVYLESQGYVVRTNEKFYHLKNITTKTGNQMIQHVPIEVDILAIKPRKDKLIGEVKTWFGSKGCYSGCFKELWAPRKWEGHDPFRVINNEKVAQSLFNQVEKKYGKGFRYVLFLGKIYKRERSKIYEYIASREINNQSVKIIEFEAVMKYIIDMMKEKRSQYANDRVLQTLKILDFYGMLK